MGGMYRECNWDHNHRNRALLPYHASGNFNTVPSVTFSIMPFHSVRSIADRSIANYIDMVEGAKRVVDIT